MTTPGDPSLPVSAAEADATRALGARVGAAIHAAVEV